MISSKQNGEYYLWGDNCDGWHLVANEQLSVIEERMPAGAVEQRHYHQYAQQFFYVLEGVLSFELDGEIYQLAEGEGLLVAAGKSHQARNDSEAEVRFIVTSTPPSHGDRIVS
ncbi:cupin domain-containing protein [Paraferrimonas sp. SM1919]|uniref:cupin domain-containing protein n=1 Tax=Paraferrimonas sp. SM1919 TaxID=2662263 RepID=UPI0013D817F2|nr:cupin domain-containing protein [Paraferrimonas sp. SM1919]